jgi:phage-related protein
VALNIGQLVATLDADDSGMVRGLTSAELAMAGFQRDAEGRLRRVDGSLVSTSTAARELGRAMLDGADQGTLATQGLRRNAAGDLTNVLGGLRGVDDAAERMGHQLLAGSDLGRRAVRDLGDDSERHLGARGLLRVLRTAGGGLLSLRGPLGSVASGVGGIGAKLAPLLAKIGSAVPLVAGLAGTLESIAPAGAVAASGIVMAITAVGAFKLGMSGVSDAVKAAFDPGTKPDQLKQALDKLAPPARQFVLELRQMKPQFDALKLGVQGALFRGLAGHVRDLGASVLPLLRTQLTQTASTLNRMALGVVDTATSLADDGTFGRALKGANAGLRNLAGIPGQVVLALGELSAAGAPAFQRFTAIVGKHVGDLSKKLDAAFQSGRLSDAINTAIGVLRGLGDVLSNVGSIIGSVFKAAGASGGSWLGILKDITGAMKTAFASPDVQAALKALFSTMSILGKTLAPLVAQALGLIAPVLTMLAPPAQMLIKVLGAALKPIIAALGPVLQAAAFAVDQLVSAAAPLLPIIGQMIASLGPILAPILTLVGQLFGDLAPVLAEIGKVLLPPFAVIVKTVGKAFDQLAPVLDTAIQQLGTSGLVPIIAALGTVISDLVNGYSQQFMQMFQQLLPIIPVLIPVVVQLAQSIAQILTAIAPLLPQIMLMSAQLITALLPAILPLLPPLAQLTTALIQLATWAITKVVVPVLSGLIKFLGGIKAALQPAIDAITWLTTQIARAFEWLYDHLVGHSVIPDMVNAIVRWLTGLPGRALAALGGLAGKLGGVVEDAANSMIRAVITGLKAVVSWLGGLPSRAKSALGSLGGVLWGAGQSLIRGFIGGIESMYGNVKSSLGSLTGKLTSWKGPASLDAVILRGNGRLVIGGFMAGIADQVPALRRQLGSITGDLPGMGRVGVGAAGGAGGGSAAAGGTARVVFDVTGSDEDLKRMIRKMVRIDGGGGPNSVQLAFGR